MDHIEATRTMAAERYLLNQLTLEDRDSFEIHFFSCSECANDLRAAAAFLQEAKAQLPEFATSTLAHPQPVIPVETRPVQPRRSSWWRPAIVIPAFVALLAVLGYQDLFTLKAMRSTSAQPRVIPRVALRANSTADASVPVAATRGRGVVLLIDFPQPANTYASYTIDLQYPRTGQPWTQTVSSSVASNTQAEPLSVLIPAAGLQPGPYHLAVYGVTAHGRRALLDRSTLDVEFHSPSAHG